MVRILLENSPDSDVQMQWFSDHDPSTVGPTQIIQQFSHVGPIQQTQVKDHELWSKQNELFRKLHLSIQAKSSTNKFKKKQNRKIQIPQLQKNQIPQTNEDQKT